MLVSPIENDYNAPLRLEKLIYIKLINDFMKAIFICLTE